jgi:hypothetical protein
VVDPADDSRSGETNAYGGRSGELYLVKISLVTAAMLYLSRRAWHKASIRAVLPDPTGLIMPHVSHNHIKALEYRSKRGGPKQDLALIDLRFTFNIDSPSNADSESTIFPVASLYQRHLAVDI